MDNQMNQMTLKEARLNINFLNYQGQTNIWKNVKGKNSNFLFRQVTILLKYLTMKFQ